MIHSSKACNKEDVVALHTPRNHRGSGVRAAADGWNANNLLFIIFVPLQAPSAVVIVPHDGEGG